MNLRAVVIAAVVAGFGLGVPTYSFAEEPEEGNPKQTTGHPEEETGKEEAKPKADMAPKDHEGNPKEPTPQ